MFGKGLGDRRSDADLPPPSLVCRVQSALTKPRQVGEDLVGGLGPDERLRVLVVDVEVAEDGRLELGGAAMRAAADLLLGEEREEGLDEVDPGRSGRREVEMVARVFGQPAMDQRRLVRADVVEDDVDLETGRHARLDRVEKGPELDRPVTPVALADHRPVATSRAANRLVVPWRA